MPAHRIVGGGLSIPLRKFDVVGMDSGVKPEFIRHVALSIEDRDSGTELNPLAMVHMGPPLATVQNTKRISCCASAELTVDETNQIGVFVDEAEGEMKAADVRVNARAQYTITPYSMSADGTVKHRRYSCAGFVIEAYQDAGIDLISTTENSLPPIDLNTLIDQYPDFSSILQTPRLRDQFGLHGEGPWNAVLAGYVVNSLERAGHEIRAAPFRPQAGDEFFPTRRAERTGA